MRHQQITMVYAAISDSGRFRKENQDNIYCIGKYRANISCEKKYYCEGIARNDALFAVADGMGGEANGTNIALGAVRGLINLKAPVTNDLLIEYVHNYNLSVCELIDHNNGERMGTTFASLSIHDGVAEMLNIGDSRIYLFRNTELQCISRDDTLVRALVEKGVITAEQAKKHPSRHRLTQHIGVFPDELIIEPHTQSFDVLHGDIFLMCSDGLTDVLTDSEISVVLSQKSQVVHKVNTLYELAYMGSKDNITIIVAEIV